ANDVCALDRTGCRTAWTVNVEQYARHIGVVVCFADGPADRVVGDQPAFCIQAASAGHETANDRDHRDAAADLGIYIAGLASDCWSSCQRRTECAGERLKALAVDAHAIAENGGDGCSLPGIEKKRRRKQF